MKKLGLILALAFCLGLASPPALFSQTEEPGASAMTALLRSIPLKNLKYEKASLAKVLTDLQTTAKSVLSPDSKIHVQLVYKAPDSAGSGTIPVVDLNLENTSLYDALSMISVVHGLELKIHAKGVDLSPSEALSLTSW